MNTASPDDDDSAFLVCEDEMIHPDVFLAENPATSPVTIFRLTTHTERSVRLALASRPDLPVRAYQRLTGDLDPEVAEAAAVNLRRKRPPKPMP